MAALGASLAISALAEQAAGTVEPRALIERAAVLGYREVQLSAMMPGLRARELDRSARRDLGALLRRGGLECSGLDLWIPPEHFLVSGLVDRAVEVSTQTAVLAAGLIGAGGIVAMSIPAGAPPAVWRAIRDAASAHGVRIANHIWPPVEVAPEDPIGIGLDPAALLLAGEDPIGRASKLGGALVQARLTDASAIGRVTPGERTGRLDLLAFRATLSIIAYEGSVVVDLRGVPNPADDAAAAALSNWNDAVFS